MSEDILDLSLDEIIRRKLTRSSNARKFVGGASKNQTQVLAPRRKTKILGNKKTGFITSFKKTVARPAITRNAAAVQVKSTTDVRNRLGRNVTRSRNIGSQQEFDDIPMSLEGSGSKDFFTLWSQRRKQSQQEVVRRRADQARRTLTTSRQNDRATSRFNAFNRRRGIPFELQTKSSQDSYSEQVINGAVVKGLRSDEILKQKMEGKLHRNRLERVEHTNERKRKRRRTEVPEPPENPLPYSRGLLVSISNDIYERNYIRDEVLHYRTYQKAYKAQRPHTPEYYSEEPHVISDSESDYSCSPPSRPPVARRHKKGERYSDEDIQMIPADEAHSSSRASAKESSKNSRLALLLNLTSERPQPKRHMQVLDQQIQKEIAMLQGKEVTLNSGPGPGIKGLKLSPSKTASSLHERFTQEKVVVT